MSQKQGKENAEESPNSSSAEYTPDPRPSFSEEKIKDRRRSTRISKNVGTSQESESKRSIKKRSA